MWFIKLLFYIKFNLSDWWKTSTTDLLTVTDLSPWNDWSLICDLFQWDSSNFLLNWTIFNVIIFLNVRIKSVFNLILWSTWKFFADFRPFATYFCVKFYNFSILFISPIVPFNFGIKLVDKPLTNLFSCFSSDHLREKFPILSNFFYHFSNRFILLGGPYLSVNTKLRQTTIPMKALVFISVSHKSSYTCPFLRVFFIQLNKLVILFSAPCFYFSFFGVSIFVCDLKFKFFSILCCDWYCVFCFHFFYFYLYNLKLI